MVTKDKIGNASTGATLSDENVESLDFSTDLSDVSKAASPSTGGVYDPRPQEDGARRMIAYLLIGLLWLVVAGMLILIACEVIEVAEIKDFAVILGPIVTLVSAATGFYYGTKSNVSPDND